MEMSLLVNLIELIYSPKCKSNFYMTIASLMLIHFWILSTYLIGYLATSPASPSLPTPPSSPVAATLSSSSSIISPTAAAAAASKGDASNTNSNGGTGLDLSSMMLNHHNVLWNLAECVCALVGGLGSAVFVKNMFLIVFESSHFVDAGGFVSSASSASVDVAATSNVVGDEEDLRPLKPMPNMDDPFQVRFQSQKRKRTLMQLFRREHIELMRCYQKKLLKFFVTMQGNLLISAVCILFLVGVVTENTLDKLFNQSCVESLVNSTRLQICPNLFTFDFETSPSLIRTNVDGSSSSSSSSSSTHLSSHATFFSWKHEILNRKVTLNTPSSSLSNGGGVRESSSLIQKLLPAPPRLGTNDGGGNGSSFTSPSELIARLASAKLTPIEDVYIMLICISLFSFFAALITPVVLVKPTTTPSSPLPPHNRRASNRIVLRKRREMSLSRELLDDNDDDSTGGFLNTNVNAIGRLSSSFSHALVFKNHNSLAHLHFLMPLVFFQGFIKTILFNELNKWYASCLNGTTHLAQLLICFGISSFLSILSLSILIIVCNLKRNVLFLLSFVQQFTILVLLFYWDPIKPNDLKTYYIDYVFFVCYAICDNLWMAHNLKSLMEKAHKLDKSPCAVLVYAYSIFCLGSSFGYAMSIYFCFPIKLYISIIFLVAFSFIYVMLEGYFYLKRKLI